MAKKTTKINEIDYSDTRNSIELYLAKAIGENVTLPDTDSERILVYLRKLIEVIEQGGGTEVIANPTLVGTEPDLTGLEVDGVKYKTGGAKLYKHNIYMVYNDTDAGWIAEMCLSIYSTRSTPYDFDALLSIVRNEGAQVSSWIFTSISGYSRTGGSTRNIYALRCNFSTDNLYAVYQGGSTTIVKNNTTVTDAVTQIL